MSKFDLSTYGVDAFSPEEERQVNGGWINVVLAAMASMIICEMCFNPTETKNNFKEGYASVRNKSR